MADGIKMQAVNKFHSSLKNDVGNIKFSQSA